MEVLMSQKEWPRIGRYIGITGERDFEEELYFGNEHMNNYQYNCRVYGDEIPLMSSEQRVVIQQKALPKISRTEISAIMFQTHKDILSKCSSILTKADFQKACDESACRIYNRLCKLM